MGYTQRLAFDIVRSINSATFTGSFQAVGSPLSYPASIVKIVNNSNEFVSISLDGTNTHDIVPETSFVLYDLTANLPNSTDIMVLPANTQFYVSGAAGTGSVYIVVLYVVRQ